jgi:hypothetical protein
MRVWGKRRHRVCIIVIVPMAQRWSAGMGLCYSAFQCDKQDVARGARYYGEWLAR